MRGAVMRGAVMRGAVTGGAAPGGRRRKDGPDRRGGEAHVAEWHRVGAKRVLGDVGRGEGSCAQGERGDCPHGWRGGGQEGRDNGGDVKNSVWERRRRR